MKQYRYYAFGELRSQSGTFSTDYSFTGYLKEETGNHYAKMRYYEGGIGRFLRTDPLGGINPYLYCGNDPLNFVDPWGLCMIPQMLCPDFREDGFANMLCDIYFPLEASLYESDMDVSNVPYHLRTHGPPHGNFIGGSYPYLPRGRSGRGNRGGGGGVPYWRPQPDPVVKRVVPGVLFEDESGFEIGAALRANADIVGGALANAMTYDPLSFATIQGDLMIALAQGGISNPMVWRLGGSYALYTGGLLLGASVYVGGFKGALGTSIIWLPKLGYAEYSWEKLYQYYRGKND